MPKKPKRRVATTDYLTEEFLFWGEPVTRAEIISELKKLNPPPGCIDRYLQGLDLTKRLREKVAANA